MKNIAIITVFTLLLAQIALAQDTTRRKPQDSKQRRGIDAKSGKSGGDENEKTRKALRGSGKSSEGGEEARKKLTSNCISCQKGRPEAGRPNPDGEESAKKGGNNEQRGEKKRR